MKKFIVAAAISAIFSQANAALFNFTGDIEYHNDVVQINFTLANDATNVRVWTDSFQNGTNFDPITALWNTTTGALIAENDDNRNVNPSTQTIYDSGFSLASLAAGNYAFTVATYANFVAGNNLSNPQFAYAGQTPIPLSTWCQPASHCGMGTFWSVWLDGVDSASNPGNQVPEPGSLALAALGLVSLATLRRRLAK